MGAYFAPYPANYLQRSLTVKYFAPVHILLESKTYAILKKYAPVHEIIVRGKEAYLAQDRHLADRFNVW